MPLIRCAAAAGSPRQRGHGGAEPLRLMAGGVVQVPGANGAARLLEPERGHRAEGVVVAVVGEKAPPAELGAQCLRLPAVEVEAERRGALEGAPGVGYPVQAQARDRGPTLERELGEHALVGLDLLVRDIETGAAITAGATQRFQIFDG